MPDSSSPLVFNPFDYDMHEDPYPTYARLREEEPCYHNEEMGFWVLSRFDDVLEGYRDWESFTSTDGVALEEVGSSSAPSMIGMDPPVQTKLRKLVVRAFNPKRVGALEPRVRALTTGFLDRFVEAGECDLIEHFAALLPSDVISTLLGAPTEAHQSLRTWTATMMHREDGLSSIPKAASIASKNLIKYFAGLITEKRKNPAEDLVSGLVEADLDECQVIFKTNRIGLFQEFLFNSLHLNSILRIPLSLDNIDQAIGVEQFARRVYQVDGDLVQRLIAHAVGPP